MGDISFDFVLASAYFYALLNDAEIFSKKNFFRKYRSHDIIFEIVLLFKGKWLLFQLGLRKEIVCEYKAYIT